MVAFCVDRFHVVGDHPLFSPSQYYHQPPPSAPYSGNDTSGHYGGSGGGGGYPAPQAARPQYAPPPPQHLHHPYAPYPGQAPQPQQQAYAQAPPQPYAPPAVAPPPPYHPAPAHHPLPHYAPPPPHPRYDDGGWRQPSPPRAPARVPYGSAARPAEGPSPARHRASPPPRAGGRAAALPLAAAAPPPAKKAAPAKRRASPPREAAVAPQPAVRGPLLMARRDWSEVVSVYPRLMVGPDFASVTTPLAAALLPALPGASLPRTLPPPLLRGGVGASLVDGGFAAAPRYEHTHDLPGPPAADAPCPPAGVQPTATTTFHVRVALPVGGFDAPTTPTAPHTFKAVRFVTVRREYPVADGDSDAAPQPSTIQLPGGVVDPTLDGDVSTVAAGDDAPLIAAAHRHCAAQLGLDLTPATGWTRVCEAAFQRAPGDTLDTFVTLLPDASPCVPSAAAWDAAWAARCAFGRARAAAAAAVADGGDPASAAAAAAEGEPGEADPPPPDDAAIVLRGRRWSDGSLWRSASVSLHGLLDYDADDRDEGTAVLSLFAETVADALTWEAGVRVAVFAAVAVDGAADKKRKRGDSAADTDLAAAFRLVDCGGRGVLRADDVRRLLHGLGYGASHRSVKDAVRAAVVRSGGRSGEVRWSELELVE